MPQSVSHLVMSCHVCFTPGETVSRASHLAQPPPWGASHLQMGCLRCGPCLVRFSPGVVHDSRDSHSAHICGSHLVRPRVRRLTPSRKDVRCVRDSGGSAPSDTVSATFPVTPEELCDMRHVGLLGGHVIQSSGREGVRVDPTQKVLPLSWKGAGGDINFEIESTTFPVSS